MREIYVRREAICNERRKRWGERKPSLRLGEKKEES